MSDKSFKESLLVPASFFKTSREEKKVRKIRQSSKPYPDNPLSILGNESVPADLRLKYFDNHTIKNSSTESEGDCTNEVIVFSTLTYRV